MEDQRGSRDLHRTFSVREDWLAWLPEEKDRIFASVHSKLEVSYVILSVSLSDALTLCQKDTSPLAVEPSAITVTLFDRLAKQVQGVLRALGEHGRRFGTVPAVVALRPGFFRSAQAQRVARANHVVSRVLFSVRARFFRKIRGLLRIVSGLAQETRLIARQQSQEIAQSWNRLEVLQYDLNTCLRETMVILKSFLCVLPNLELIPLEGSLLSRMPQQVQFFLDDRPVSDHNS